MKGYKGFDKDLKCNSLQYEIGKTYEIDGFLKMCKNGFHFCKKLIDVNNYYRIICSRICEVEALGKVLTKDDKCCTDKIKIVRELSKEEIKQFFKDNLNKLINDKDWRVRLVVAELGYGLDKLVNDKDWCVRKAVAEQGYGLDKLVNDKDWCVREAVARQGYGLDKLVNDEDLYVRLAAKLKLKEKENEKNK